MSDYKKHILFGGIFVLVYTIVYNGLRFPLPIFQLLPQDYNSLYIIIVDCLLVLFFSLLPDIDADASIINKFVNSGLVIAAIYLILAGNPYLSILPIIIIFILEWVKHRGITHNLIFGLSMSFATIMFLPLYFAGTALSAFISHLVLDKELP